ncbi:Holliday junction branch migration protein RuvA [Telmatospirillum sp. J64-1]|uniref:Holliday junction branch migration protein RuvA n=1 Tax=Telmatospirillum sp. J64-1 TaxID=2502183 RepID=UPI00115EB2D7|nr:Holliday junction branch migration protein RuvA [Telmatospirillum sp. J64-1]
MIAKLKGIVDSTAEDYAVIDVGGVGYLVFCSSRTLGRMIVGEAVQVHVETHVREDAIQLYGFLETAEREWFRLLTTVQGVGSRVGLAILSVAAPDQLAQGIAAQDKTVLTRASGVGPKLAARILSELKEKAGKIALGSFAPAGGAPAAALAPIGASGAVSDAVSALVNLGYRQVDAFGAVARAAQEMGEDADVSALIRAGLKELGPKDF